MATEHLPSRCTVAVEQSPTILVLEHFSKGKGHFWANILAAVLSIEFHQLSLSFIEAMLFTVIPMLSYVET